MFEGASGASVNGPAANPINGDAPVQLAQATPAQIGSVEELAGTVTLTRADGSSATAAPGDPVFLNDTVATSPDGSVEIVFVDGTRFSLGQDGQMTLDQLVYNPGGDDNELDLSVVQGAFTFVTGAIAGAPGEGMEVNVPVGTIGIRGTAVGGGPDLSTADPTDYTVVLLPEQGGRVGRIVLTDVNGRSVILDQALEAMDISTLGLAPGEPVQLTREQVLDLLGLAVENLEDILDEIQNFESPEEEQNPEAGEQRGDAGPAAPNTGGVNTPKGDTQSLDELTTLFSLSDEQGFGDGDGGGPLGGFTPGGGLGNEDDAPQDDPFETDGPAGSDDPVPGDDTPPPQSGLFLLEGGQGDDVLDASEIGAANIVGLGGNDTLIGSSEDDILNGGDGDDTLDAGAGNDQVNGGGGNDLIIGGSGEGNDQYDGGTGIDTVKYSSATQSITVNLDTGVASGDPAIGNDTLANIENVIGGSGADSITGNGAANRLEGGSGDDELTGLGGNDTIIGGDGDDVVVFTGNRSDYEITGAEGGFFVTDLRDGPNDGTDFVADDVEALRFADQDVSVVPDAVDDNHVVGEAQQEVTNGAAMKTAVTVAAGAVLTLQCNFLDSEPASAEATFKDFAVLVIDGQVIKLKDVDDSETPLGDLAINFDEHTGFFEVTFTFNEPGSHTIGLAVLNEGDQLFDAGLLVDNVSISGGSFGDGFESGLEGWETIGTVTTEGAVEGIPAPQGEQQALLVSNGASSAAVEQFLGLPPGALSTVGNQPVISGNVLENDNTGGADVAVAGVAYAGAPEDVEDVNGTTEGSVVTFTASDGSWTLALDLSTGGYVFTVLETLQHSGGNVLSFPFTYTIEGITGITDSATLTILVNDGVPSAVDDTASATEGGQEIGGNVLFNDGFSPDGGWVTAITVGGETYTVLGGEPAVVETSLGGTLIIAASGEWTYTPPALLEGTGAALDSFTYTVTDGDGDQDTATVAITVEQGTNQPPSVPIDDNDAGDSVIEGAEGGTPVGITAISGDPEQGTVTYTLTDDAGGRFQIDSVTGVVTVLNGALLDFETGASHQITVQASDGTLTSSQTFTIGVVDGNEAPDAVDDTADEEGYGFIAEEDSELTLFSSNLLANDSDPNGDDLFVSSAGNAVGGTVALGIEGSIIFTPELNYSGPASFSYIVSDGNGGFDTATVNLTVTPVNDAPEAADDAATTTENAVLSTVAPGVLANDTDADAGDSKTVVAVNDSAAGVGTQITLESGALLTLNADGSYSYDPNGHFESLQAGESATDGFSYTVRDSGGLESTATVTITINGVSEPPLPETFAAVVAEDAAYQLNTDEINTTDSDTPQNGIVYTLDSQPDHGTIQREGVTLGNGATFTQADIDAGLVSYIHDGGPETSDAFDVSVSDGTNPAVQRSVAITIVQSGTAMDVDVAVGDTIVVGDTAYGRFDVVGGGSQIASGVIIGNEASGDGFVRIAGAESSLTTQGVDNGFVVGRNGTGELRVEAGGLASALAYEVGREDGASGVVTVTGAGSRLLASNDFGVFTGDDAPYAGFVGVGRRGGSDGELNVLDGGVVEIRTSEPGNTATRAPGMTIAEDLGSTGTVLVSGTGSAIDIAQNPDLVVDPDGQSEYLRGPYLTIGERGQADMTVTQGAQVSMSGNESYVGVGGGNFDDPEDTTPLPQSTLTVSAGGSLTITETLSGANVTNYGGLYVGDFRNGNGKVTVTGDGSSITTHGTNAGISVGGKGSGILDVTDGGEVGTLWLNVGFGTTGTGTVNLSGAGSQIVASSDYGTYSSPDEAEDAGSVQVGRHDGSKGYFNITEGGALLITEGQSTTTRYPWMNIARDAGSEGHVLVDGAGSTLTIGEQEGSFGSGIAVGRGGIGTLTLTNGAVATVRGEEAEVTVGAGWDNTADDPEAEGVLSISGGAKFELLNASTEGGGFWIGDGEFASGMVTVDGTESVLSVANSFMYVGGEGQGSVSVRNGGQVAVGTALDALADIHVRSTGRLDIADGTVAADVSVDGGRLSVQDGGVATGQIDGNLSFVSGGTLQIDASATNRDQLNVAGQASFTSGLISFSFLTGYLPQEEHNFTFLTANALEYDDSAVALEAWDVAPEFEFEVYAAEGSLRFLAHNEATAGNGVVRYGTFSEDSISGTDGNDGLHGRDGADALAGGLGDDRLVGGAGADTLDGGEGSDTADFSDLVDTAILVDLGAGTAEDDGDVVDTLVSIENAIGTSLHDLIVGTGGANHLVGGAGGDMLMGQGGADILDGGEGADTLMIGGLDFNIVDGGDDLDTLSFAISGLTLNLANEDIRSVEQIDLTGSTSGGNVLALSAADVISISDDVRVDGETGGQTTVMTVLGDAQDSIQFTDAAGWTFQDQVVFGSNSFNIFTNGTVAIIADADINTNLTNLAG